MTTSLANRNVLPPTTDGSMRVTQVEESGDDQNGANRVSKREEVWLEGIGKIEVDSTIIASDDIGGGGAALVMMGLSQNRARAVGYS